MSQTHCAAAVPAFLGGPNGQTGFGAIWQRIKRLEEIIDLIEFVDSLIWLATK